MKQEKKIPFLIESENGHDEKLVPESKVVEEAEKQLKDGKWVTVEKKDGSTEMITELPKAKEVITEGADTPEEDDLDEEDKELMTLSSAPSAKVPEKVETKKEEVKSEAAVEKKPDDWKGSFGGAKSVTATNKMKGG